MTKRFGVVFDLDGTLADTLGTIAFVANRGLEALGFATHPVDAYRQFVGDGIVALCERVLPTDHVHRRDDLLETLRPLYRVHRSEGASLYPGMHELLLELRRRDIPLGVLSNKPDELTHGTLEDLGVYDLFGAILGQRPEIPKKPAADGAHIVLERLRLRPEDTLYLGDTSTDMKTAHTAGLHAVGVLWGFRSREELVEHGAETLVQEPAEVLPLLERLRGGLLKGGPARSG